MPAIAESPAAGVLDSWNQAMASHNLDASAEPIAAPEPSAPEKPAPTETPKPEPVVEKPKSDVPDEFIEPKTEAPKEEPVDDGDEKFLNEEPPLKGSLKENIKALHSQTKNLVGKLKAEKAELLKQLESKAAPVSQPVDTEATTAELTALRQQLAEREEILAKVAVERSPQFKQQFLDREEMIVAKAKTVLKEFGADEGLFDQLANASLKKRAEILDNSELSQSAQSLLVAQITRYDELQGDKAATLSKSRGELQAWESEQRLTQEKQRVEAEAREAQIFNARLDKAKADWIELRRVEGNDEWNAGAEAAEEEARQFFSGKMPIDAVADIALAGVIQKRTALILKRTQERLREAQQKLADREAASPGVTARTTQAKEAARTPADTFREQMQRIGAA